MIRVTVWNENIHEKEIPEQMAHYPRGIHGAIAEYLQKSPDELDVRIATQDQPACGLPDDVLNTTDVMIWWGHAGHHLVPDDLARRVADRVLLGMGLIVLHSGHYSKPFRLLMGTTCSLRCRDGDYERLWCVDPGHPIAKGFSIFPGRTSWCSLAGSAAGSCSAPAAAGGAARAKSFISSPATKPIRYIAIPIS